MAVLWPGRQVPLRLDPLLLFRASEIGDELLFLNRDRNGRQVEYLSYTFSNKSSRIWRGMSSSGHRCCSAAATASGIVSRISMAVSTPIMDVLRESHDVGLVPKRSSDVGRPVASARSSHVASRCAIAVTVIDFFGRCRLTDRSISVARQCLQYSMAALPRRNILGGAR